MMKIDYSHLNNSVTPAKKNDGDVEKGMEKQAGYYSLEQNEGQQLGWFDDEQGKFIGEHWLNGSGMDVRINSEEWANYMRSSMSINNLLMKMIDHDFQTRKGSDSFWLRTKGDTGFNDRRTGLGMLHTTSNLFVHWDISPISGPQFSYNATLIWVDKIDPNPSQGDGAFSWIAKQLGYTPKDYRISIRWTQSFIVSPK